jgi:NitT/TauT family transport system substrate-binding protein
MGGAPMAAQASLLRIILPITALLFTSATQAADLKPVRVAVSNSSSDVGIYIADKKGYFREEGLEIILSNFDSAAKMIAPMGAGDLDVGSGSATAGLYNAVARGINIKIVSPNANAPPGYGHNILLIRKAHVDSGRYKTLADLKGMKVALTSPGASSTSTINEALKKAGLKFSDIEPVYLGYPNHVIALSNGAVDAGLTAEPAATQATNAGSAVRVMSDDVIDPYHEAAVELFSGQFIEKNPDAAYRFMRAFLKAIRFYNDSLKDGMIKGKTADEVVSILTEYTNIKDPAIYRSIAPQGSQPDGRLNMESLQKDFDFYKTQGWIEGKVTVEQAVDTRFIDAALKDLGPYKPQ